VSARADRGGAWGGGRSRGRHGALPGLALALLLAGCADTPGAQAPAAAFRGPDGAEATTWLPAAPPDRRIRYAAESPAQYGDLRLPRGRAPAAGHPVALVIHGGAWHADWTSDYVAPLAEALTARGIATWTIAFRRLGNRGGGYPGTFTDVGRATDALRELAARYPLDLDRVVAVGHSSGGHLALWVAGRRGLPSGHPLRGPDPLPLAGVVSLAGIPDLEAALARGDRRDVLELLATGQAGAGPRLAAASPARMLPLRLPQVLMVGTGDDAWRIASTEAYAAAAEAAGDPVTLRILEGANHADVIDPLGPAPALVARAVLSLTGAADVR
jgi:acetyl esterase/lipase